MNVQLNWFKLSSILATAFLAATPALAAGDLRIKGLEAVIRDIRHYPNRAQMQSQLKFKSADQYSIQISRTGRYTDSTHQLPEVGYLIRFTDPVYKAIRDKHEAGTLYISAWAIRFESELTLSESETTGFFKHGDRFKTKQLGELAAKIRDLKKIFDRIGRADAAVQEKLGRSSLAVPASEMPVNLIGDVFSNVKAKYEISLDGKADPQVIAEFISAYFTELVNEESHLSMEWNARAHDGIPQVSVCSRLLDGLKSIFH